MSKHESGLLARLEADLALPDFSIILLNALTAIDDETDIAEILQYELIQDTVDGYNPQEYSYTAGTAIYDATNQWAVAPNVLAEFSEAVSNAGMTHTHVVFWQGRGLTANKQISSVNTSTSRITLTGHGMTNGDLGFVRSTGTLPAGLAIELYYIKVIDTNTLELYTDSALTTQKTFSTSGTGTLYMQYANGSLWEYESNSGTINPGSSKSFDFVYRVS